MTGLAIEGEPNGWLDIGYSVSTLATRLEAGLSDASRLGAQALARSWYGPTATAFSSDWAARRARFEDLVDLVRRAAHAIAAYGQALLDMQERARALEYTWCSAGLHVLPGGEGFTLPPGSGALPPHPRMSLEQTLSDATRDVVDLGVGVLALAGDLAAVLVPLIALLEEFGLAGFGAAFVREYGHELMQDVKDSSALIGHAVDAAGRVMDDRAVNAKIFASQLAYDLRNGTAGERSAAAGLLPTAGRDAAHAEGVAKWLGVGGLVVGLLGVGGKVFYDGHREGYAASLQQNAGDIGSLTFSSAADGMLGEAAAGAVGGGLIDAAGAALLAAGAPEIAVGVGVAVIGGAVAIGVGAGVQAIVDHRKAIGHFVESVL